MRLVEPDLIENLDPAVSGAQADRIPCERLKISIEHCISFGAEPMMSSLPWQMHPARSEWIKPPLR